MTADSPSVPSPTSPKMATPRFVEGTVGGYYKYVDADAVAGQELTLWTIAPENLNYFIDVAGAGLTPQDSSTVTNATSQSKGGSASVSRFPGDPAPYSRANVPKTIMKNRNVRHGNALPGRRFILDDGTERRQFTYQGNLAALHALLVGHLKMDVMFTHYNGSTERITAPTQG